MAKKDSKKSKKGKKAPDRAEVVDSVKERGKGLIEEVSAAAQRIRDSFDDVRVVDDIRALRTEVAALAGRVAKLEQGSSGAPARAAAGAARKTTARKTAAPSPPAPKPAGGTAATRTRSTATAAASGGTGKRPAAAKRSTAARKPAGS